MNRRARSVVLSGLAVLAGCCPDARPPRDVSKSDSNQSLQLLAGLLAERGSTQTESPPPAARRDDQRERGGPKDSRKAREKEPAAAGDAAPAEAEESRVPRPRVTREMIDKSKAAVLDAITPESADEQLGLLEKELEGVPPVEPTADSGAEPTPAGEGDQGADEGVEESGAAEEGAAEEGADDGAPADGG